VSSATRAQPAKVKQPHAHLDVRHVFIASVLVFAVAVAGCDGSTGSSVQPACEKAPAGIGPDANATLQDADAGRTVCLTPGEVLTVFLHAPVGEARWGTITAANHAVLSPLSSGVLTLPIGVTAAVYRAGKTGTTRLDSTRPPCSPPEVTGCDAAHEWSAHVVVR
jgi:hypothetical protein